MCSVWGWGPRRALPGTQPLAVEAQLDLQRFHPARRSEAQICPYNFGTGIKRSAVPFEMDFAYKRVDEHQKHVRFIQSDQYTRHSNSEVKMDCGFLLMTLGNFGPRPCSGWTNRAVCLLAVRHILGDETKTPSQGSGHPQAAHLDQQRAVRPKAGPWPLAPGRPSPPAPIFQARPHVAFPTFLLAAQTPAARPSEARQLGVA